MVRAGCVFVAGIHPSRTWTSGSFESVRWNACVHRLDLGLYSHPKEFWGNGVWTHVNSKGKIPSTGKCPQRSIEPATLWQRAQALPTELFRSPEGFWIWCLSYRKRGAVIDGWWDRSHSQNSRSQQSTLSKFFKNSNKTVTLIWLVICMIYIISYIWKVIMVKKQDWGNKSRTQPIKANIFLPSIYSMTLTKYVDQQ